MTCTICSALVCEYSLAWEPVYMTANGTRHNGVICPQCIARGSVAAESEINLDVWEDLAIFSTMAAFGPEN